MFNNLGKEKTVIIDFVFKSGKKITTVLESFVPNVSDLFKISFDRSTITSPTMVGSNGYLSLNTVPTKSEVTSLL